MKQIPLDSIPLERLLLKISNADCRTLAISGVEAETGCTTLALSLASRAAVQGKKILLVDFNLLDSALSHNFDKAFKAGQDVVSDLKRNIQTTELDNLDILPAPTTRDYLLQLRDTKILKQCLQAIETHYDLIIFDCSPISTNENQIITPELVCAACQYCVLVVLAGRTLEIKIEDTISKLKTANANVLGFVINDQFQAPLAEELSRETERLEKIFPNWMKKLLEKIQKSPFLNIDL